MEDLFLRLLNMSITASYFALAVIVLRLIFRKMPKWLNCLLWGLVGLRLILPFSFESILSLIPSSETVPGDIIISSEPHITSGIHIFNSAVNPIISETFAPDPSYSANPLQIVTFVLSAIWLTGTAVMLIYALLSYLHIKRKTSCSIKAEKGVFVCDNIDTPFILGVIKPKIFIPSFIDDESITLILAHEKAHLKRLDHIWKPLAFMLLSVYWFNPLMWAVFVLLCRDIESACDEKVIREMDADGKKSYSNALITCSAPKRYITACPLAFGETGVKQRIKNVLNYKKPTLWLIITALIVSGVLSVCFMTNPAGMKLDDIVGFDDIFEDAEKIQLFIGSGFIYTTEDTKPELSEIKKVRLEKYTVDESTDKSYRIEINDETTINIDESFSTLWLNNESARSSTYKIKNPGILKNLFSVTNYVSGMDGIYVSIEEIEETEAGLYFNVTWHNERSETVEYGEMYTLERFTAEGVYEEVPFPENFVFLLPSYILKGNSTAEKSYYCPMKLSEGEYRFTTTFSTDDGKSYYAKTVFFIGKNRIDDSAKKLLTLDDVRSLSEKGKELTWSDFEEFSCIETGSGLYIRAYKIDGRFSLTIGGSGTDNKPMYIYLCAPNGLRIDIRGDDVESFIEENKDVPIPEPGLSFGTRKFIVDSTGNNLNEIMKFGAYPPTIWSHLLTFATVRIDSLSELERFYEHFDGIMNFDMKNDETAFSFSEIRTIYSEEMKPGFFDEHCLLIVYATASNEQSGFDVVSLQPDSEKLYINLRENSYEDTEDSVTTGWLLVIDVYKEYLTKTEKIIAYIGVTVELPEPEITHFYTQVAEHGIEYHRCIYLFDDNTFHLSVSPYSSFLEYGTFEYQGDLLILTSEDKERRYVFEVNKNSLIFKKDSSEVYKLFSTEDVPDGTVFMLQ